MQIVQVSRIWRFQGLLALALCSLLSDGRAQGQTTVNWDASGNGLLSGTYNFREIEYVTDQIGSNSLVDASVEYGTITFDGNGNYSLSSTFRQSSSTLPQSRSFSGTYTLAANGFGFIRRSDLNGGVLNGMVAHDVFVGSSTESVINNLFIAAKVGATPVTTGTFNQGYSLAYMNLPALDMAQIRDAAFQILPNGAGAFPMTTVTGRVGGSTTTVSQTFSASTYSFAGGVGTLTLAGGAPGGTPLTSGSMQFYVSPDGTFLFGGSTTGWDMLVGVRTPIASVPAANLDGLYYSAAMEVDRRTLPSGLAILDSYYGAFKRVGGTVIGHQRILVAPDENPYDYTYSDFFLPASTGVHTDLFGYRNFVSADGKFQVGVGEGTFLGVNVSLKAPELSGSGVFLNPTGVVNAANFTPFTVGISRGEVITLFGTNMSTGTAVDATFPATLGGAQVLINGTVAPLYSVSPGQISVVVPYSLQGNVAEIQVFRAGIASNRVTVFISPATPGIFTVPSTGVGAAAALHNSDGSLVTAANPAKRGEFVQIFLTGLGDVNPAVTAGRPGPTNPLSRTVLPVQVFIDNTQAEVQYSGLAPFYGGLYQVNVKIPASAASGDALVEISAPGAVNSQVRMAVSAATATDPAAISSDARPRITAAPQSGAARRGPRPAASVTRRRP